MVAYAFYESDNRIRRYAETLFKRGDVVDVICIGKKGSKRKETLSGVNVFRIQRRERSERIKLDYLLKILIFFIRSSIFLTKKHFTFKYDLIHVHSVPDFEVFSAFIPKAFGAKVILDIHDIVPEFYSNKFGANKSSFVFKLLLLSERLSCYFSSHVIISNHLWADTIIRRSVNPNKLTTILNYPDPTIFSHNLVDNITSKNKFILMYPGSLNNHQGLDIAIKAFASISKVHPKSEFHIYGEGPELNNLKFLVKTFNLNDKILFFNPLPITEISKIMVTSDLGIIPKQSDSFGNTAFSTKTLEFMALSVPIIVSDTKIDRHYLNDDITTFFRSGDPEDLAKKIKYLIESPERREHQIKAGLSFIEHNNWGVKQYIYLNLIDSLLTRLT